MSTKSTPLPFPGVQHGKRIIISVIEQRARDEPNSPWISIPVDDGDLSKGYRDVTFKQLNDAANHAAQWLLHNLPASSRPFQCLAYAGPKDLRYPILALAAGKLQKKLILPNMSMMPENHAYVLQKANCEVYLSTEHVASDIKKALQYAPEIQYMAAPRLNDLFRDTEQIAIEYTKLWDDAKDDPWLVFHSSGTTGPPKPITHTFRMVANLEVPASLPDAAESHIHQYANKRWYTHLPTLHYVGMVMVLFIPPFVNMTAILPPPDQSAENVAKILRHARADGALCTPLQLSQMLSFADGVEALKNLEYVHYAGAPLARHLGDQIISHTKLAPLIGCTESGHHFTETRPDDKEDWDYFKFQSHAGVEFEHRADGFHEMVFVRRPECAMQPIFIAFPELDRFETKDLWVQHPTRKGLWKIVGRMDDFVSLTDAKGYFVSPFEREIERHPRVEAALIGGNGCSAPVLLLEIADDGVDVDSEGGRRSFLESLEPFIARISDRSLLRLEPKLTIIARKDKPFVRTIKGTLARVPTLRLYEDDIAALFDGSM